MADLLSCCGRYDLGILCLHLFVVAFFATEHITEVSSPSVTYKKNVIEDLSALL